MDLDVFSTAQWDVSGRSDYALRRAIADGRVVRVLRGVYKGIDVPDTLAVRAKVISLIRPKTAVVAREGSAWLSDIEVLPPGRTMADTRLHLVVQVGVTPPRLPGCIASQADLPPSDVVEHDGILRTSDLRTALDLGRFAGRQQAVASLDAFLHAERVALVELWRRARLLVKVRNCRILRTNLASADSGAESYAESAQRTLFLDAGLPRPETQIPVAGLAGDLIGYLDMGWRRYQLGSEFDGEDGHGEDEREHDEKRRRRVHDETDWHIDVVRKQQLWGQPAALVAHTAQLLLSRGWQPSTADIPEQIARAAEFEAQTGKRWQWMPVDRLVS